MKIAKQIKNLLEQREDYAMKYVEKNAILDVNIKNYIKLNGTI